MEATDRELLAEIIDAMSSMVCMLSVEHSMENMQLREALHGLEPSEELKQQQKEARERFKEGSRRLQQLQMLLEGKTLREIDAVFTDRDNRSTERRRNIKRAFDQIGR